MLPWSEIPASLSGGENDPDSLSCTILVPFRRSMDRRCCFHCARGASLVRRQSYPDQRLDVGHGRCGRLHARHRQLADPADHSAARAAVGLLRDLCGRVFYERHYPPDHVGAVAAAGSVRFPRGISGRSAYGCCKHRGREPDLGRRRRLVLPGASRTGGATAEGCRCDRPEPGPGHAGNRRLELLSYEGGHRNRQDAAHQAAHGRAGLRIIARRLRHSVADLRVPGRHLVRRQFRHPGVPLVRQGHGAGVRVGQGRGGNQRALCKGRRAAERRIEHQQHDERRCRQVAAHACRPEERHGRGKEAAGAATSTC